MNSKLLKTAAPVAVALAIGSMASPATAKTYTYTFGNGDGGANCDGLTITNVGGGGVWTGSHTGCTDDDPAGGFTTSIGGLGRFIDINTTDRKNVPGIFATFLLDTKSMEWYLYGNFGYGFQLLNQGNLVKGTPPDVRKGGQPKPSIFRNLNAVDKPVF